MKMYCPTCKTEIEITIKTEKEIYPVKNDPIEIISEVTYCKRCDEQIWNKDLDTKNLEKAYEKYRKKHNLLQPKDIKRIREKYSLSQVSFAKILGLGEKTITRYENGSIQDVSQNNLIMLADYPDVFTLLLNKNNDFIPTTDYQKASEAIKKYKVKVYKGSDSFSYKPSQSQYKFACDKIFFGGLINDKIG